MAKKESFEASLKALEEIVGKLEDGGAPLEEALGLFEEGRKHARLCSQKLSEVERKIQILLEDEKGAPVLRDAEPAARDEAAPEDDFPN